MVRDNVVQTVHNLLFVESQSGEGWKGASQPSSPAPCHGQEHFPPEQLSQSLA